MNRTEIDMNRDRYRPHEQNEIDIDRYLYNTYIDK